jgi:hypothetical protein
MQWKRAVMCEGRNHGMSDQIGIDFGILKEESISPVMRYSGLW